MIETSLARVRSVDIASRTALVELNGSEGAAVTARLADSVHPQTAPPGSECLVVATPDGDRTLVATLGHNPKDSAILAPAVASTTSPPASFAYTNGTTWQDALSVSITTSGACNLWASGWLALSGSALSATSVWEMRLAVDGAASGPSTGWGSPMANLKQVCPLSASLAVSGGGTWTARLQLRLKVTGATVTCAGGLLLVDARTV